MDKAGKNAQGPIHFWLTIIIDIVIYFSHANKKAFPVVERLYIDS